MPERARSLRASNRKPNRKPPLYVVRLPKVEPVLRVWVNPKSTDDILTFAIMFGQGDVKLLPDPKGEVIALESGCEYRVSSRIPPGYVYVSSSDVVASDMQADFDIPVELLFKL
jgi:hypothetical protein